MTRYHAARLQAPSLIGSRRPGGPSRLTLRTQARSPPWCSCSSAPRPRRPGESTRCAGCDAVGLAGGSRTGLDFVTGLISFLGRVRARVNCARRANRRRKTRQPHQACTPLGQASGGDSPLVVAGSPGRELRGSGALLRPSAQSIMVWVVFERFTEAARVVIFKALKEALELGHTHVGVEHVLLGLLRTTDGNAARILHALGVDQDAFRARLLQMVPAGEPKSLTDVLPYSTRSKTVFKMAVRESLSLGMDYVGTEHLLLAISLDGNDRMMRILNEEWGLSSEVIRGAVIQPGSTESLGHEREWAVANVIAPL